MTYDRISTLRTGPPLGGPAAAMACRLGEFFRAGVDDQIAYIASESIRVEGGRCALIPAGEPARRVAARLVEKGVIRVDGAFHWRRECRHAR